MENELNKEIEDNNVNNKKELNFPLGNIRNNNDIETLKQLIESNKRIIEEEQNLKYLLSLTLKHKNPTSNDINLINYLNTFLTKNNEKIFIDYTLQCCELGKEKILKIMFEKGININCQNEYGETPLHIATSKGDKMLILFLLKFNPDKNIKTFKDKMTVYDYSKEQGEQSIINLIEDNNNDICFDNNNNNISFDDCDNKIVAVFHSFKNDINDNYIDINNEMLTKKKFSNTSNSNNNNGEFFYFDSVTEKDRYFDQIKQIENNNENNDINDNYILLDNLNFEENKSNDFDESLDNNINENNENKKDESNNYVSFIDDIISKHKFYATESNNFQKNFKVNSEKHSNINSNRITAFTGNSLNNNIVNKKNLIFSSKIPYNKSEINHKYKSYNSKNDIYLEKEEIKNKNNSERISIIYNKGINKETIKNENRNKILEFLNEIGLSKKYLNYLSKNGFDDLNVLIEQTKNGIAITDENLKEIGFKTPGKRAKFLIHLEEKANLFKFEIEKEKVYLSNSTNENKLFRLLSSISLEKYINNFLINDYTSPELLFIQMLTRQPLNEEILLNEIGIDKVGYRMRLLNKIKNESNNFLFKIKNGILGNNNFHFKKSSIVFESQRGNNNNEFCNMCLIF